MKLAASSLDNSSSCTTFERLHAKIARYALPSFFYICLYLIGPAKSVPRTSNAVPAVVRSSGS